MSPGAVHNNTPASIFRNYQRHINYRWGLAFCTSSDMKIFLQTSVRIGTNLCSTLIRYLTPSYASFPVRYVLYAGCHPCHQPTALEELLHRWNNSSRCYVTTSVSQYQNVKLFWLSLQRETTKVAVWQPKLYLAFHTCRHSSATPAEKFWRSSTLYPVFEYSTKPKLTISKQHCYIITSGRFEWDEHSSPDSGNYICIKIQCVQFQECLKKNYMFFSVCVI